MLDIDFPPSAPLFQAAYDTRKAVPCNTELSLTGSYNNLTRLLDITVTVTHHAFPPTGDLYLHVVLTESELYFEGLNGVDWHEFTMRDMIPDAQGAPIVLTGSIPQTAEYLTSLTVDSLYVEDHCDLVFFLQNHTTEDVMQAGTVRLMDLLDLTEVAELPAPFELTGNFPNPFNPVTTIAFILDEPQVVSLAVFDLTGRHICDLHRQVELGRGDHEVRWQGVDALGNPVPSGIYLYRLEVGGQIATRKMTLLK